MFIDQIFDANWFNSKSKSRSQLIYPLIKNLKFRKELEKWFIYFKNKGWLDQKMIKDLRRASSWPSFYSKINELRTGFFFEKILNFNLTKYHAPVLNKNIEFEGEVNNHKIYIEVKTPTEINSKLENDRECISFDNSEIVTNLIRGSTSQLPNNEQNIVVLSDYLNVSLLNDIKVKKYTIPNLLNINEFKKISAVCILGNIYHETLYRMIFI